MNISINRIKLDMKKLNSIEYIAYYYRYISVLITSIFFIIFTDYSMLKKSIIVLLILIASVTLNYLYSQNRKKNKYILVLLIIETFYSAVIIIFTGGFNSPFIWYTFNSMIVCFMMLDYIKYSLVCLLTYVLSGTIIPHLIFKNNYTTNFNSNTLLCLILITGLLNILYLCINDINKKNKELENANVQIKKSVNHIIGLYNTMHILTIKNNKDDIIRQIIEYSSLIFNTRNVALFINDKNKLSHQSSNGITNLNLVDYVNKNYLKICQVENVLEQEVDEKLYVFYPIKYNLKIYGILALNFEKHENNGFDSLIFIAELASIIFEKFELEKINADLIINEEQNRIANDIHDGVLQRLFSVSCCAYTLIKNIEVYDKDKIKTNLNIIRNSINNSMTDLRKTIYKLSAIKGGSNLLIEDIKDYVNEIEELNDVSISFDFNGEIEMLSLLHKKSIYKIVCELISNSIRHSKASKIEIQINIINNNISLIFQDDGVGFNYEKIMEGENHGLGLKNIEHLVNLLSGSLHVASMDKKGTKVSVFAPLLIPNSESQMGV